MAQAGKVAVESSDDDEEFEELLSFQPFSQEPIDVDKEKRGDGGQRTPKVDEVDEEALQAEAAGAAELVFIPPSITAPSQLVWQKKVKGKKIVYMPCRVCPPDEAVGLDLPRWNGMEKVLVQYIEYPLFTSYNIVQRKALIPYHGETEEDSVDCDNEKKWCKKLCSLYMKQRRRQKRKPVQIRSEMLFLERVLRHAQKTQHESETALLDNVENHVALGAVDGNDTNEETHQSSSSENCVDSDCDCETSHFVALNRSGFERKTEPIRPGDVVSYASHIFGPRIASVLSVNPNRNPVLVLDNAEHLPRDAQVKRVKIMYRGKLRDYNGVYRPLDRYVLRKDIPHNTKGVAGVAAGMMKEVQRVGEILEKNVSQFRSTVESDCGFAPLDVLHKIRTNKKSKHSEVDENQQRLPSKEPAASSVKVLPRYVSSPSIKKNKQGKRQRQEISPETGSENKTSATPEISIAKRTGTSVRRSRRRSCAGALNMTKDQLTFASEVKEALKQCWGDEFERKGLPVLEDKLSIPSYWIVKFLDGDAGNHLSLRKREETEEALREWMCPHVTDVDRTETCEESARVSMEPEKISNRL